MVEDLRKGDLSCGNERKGYGMLVLLYSNWRILYHC